MQLVIDIGNTRAKAGLFDQQELLWAMPIQQLEEHEWRALFLRNDIRAGLFSASGEIPEEWISLFTTAAFPVMPLLPSDPLPFDNRYTTPATLGLDRIANLAALQKLFPHQTALAIDVGTCVTYDLLENGKTYYGGMISPGWTMRLRAMHQFTARLPLPPTEEVPLTGTNTQSALQSGAFNGLLAEIQGIINRYKQRFPNVQVVLTGGDAEALQKHLENGIFARPHLQLIGLNELLNYHLSKL